MTDAYDRLLNREYMGKGWTNKMPHDPTHQIVRMNKIAQRKADQKKDPNSNHKELSASEPLIGVTSRGFHHHDMMKAAEELRMEGKGSHDPMYEDSKKNK